MNGYLRFDLEPRPPVGRKTDVWHVIATRDRSLLGTIKWFVPWRQYAFFPEPETVFNPDCLDEICGFIRREMIRRRIARQRRRQMVV